MPSSRVVIVVLAALTVATVGVIRLAASPGASSAATDQATMDSLTAKVTTADWTTMDHNMSGNAPGYQMPPAMMPGMPEHGDQRLAVAVTVVNTSDDTRRFRPDKEFVLRAGEDGRRWTPHSDTFGDLPRLVPRNAVNGILFFDLPPAELEGSPAWIEWARGDATNRLAIPMDGADAPSHSHTP